MSAAGRLARDWWNTEFGEGYPTGTEHDQDDMLRAFVAGFEAACMAGWFGIDEPFTTGEIDRRPSKAGSQPATGRPKVTK